MKDRLTGLSPMYTIAEECGRWLSSHVVLTQFAGTSHKISNRKYQNGLSSKVKIMNTENLLQVPIFWQKLQLPFQVSCVRCRHKQQLLTQVCVSAPDHIPKHCNSNTHNTITFTSHTYHLITGHKW
jgi:hypothetical protein